MRLKLVSFIVVLFCLLPGSVVAQTWKGLYRHHDFVCTKLDVPGYPIVLAAKSLFDEHRIQPRTCIKLKIKSPFAWGKGMYDAQLSATAFYTNGTVMTTDTYAFFCCRDGWIYYTIPIVDGIPEYDLWLTIYEYNDWGKQGGKKKTLKLQLFRLPVAKLPMNYNMSLYW